MAPKLHTSQIFKGLTYMFVWINNNKFTLVSRSNFLKTRKNYYTPEICKNSKTTPHAWKSQLFTSRSDQMFLCVAGKHAIFLCFTCSSDGPLQITRGLMKKALLKRCKYWFFFEGPRWNYQWRHHISRNGYLPDW